MSFLKKKENFPDFMKAFSFFLFDQTHTLF